MGTVIVRGIESKGVSGARSYAQLRSFFLINKLVVPVYFTSFHDKNLRLITQDPDARRAIEWYKIDLTGETPAECFTQLRKRGINNFRGLPPENEYDPSGMYLTLMSIPEDQLSIQDRQEMKFIELCTTF